MKKIVLGLLFLAVMGFVDLEAQSSKSRFGFQLSPTFSWANSNDNSIATDGTNLGIRIGLLYQYEFAENYAFISGIGISLNQGGTLMHEVGGNLWGNAELSDDRYRDLANGVQLQYNLQYLEVPLALRMSTAENRDNMRFYVEPGVSLGIITQARGDIEGVDEPTENENINKAVNSFNISYGVGAGVELITNSSVSLLGGIFYNGYFLDFTKDKNSFQFIRDESGAITEMVEEDSRGTIGSITIRLAVLF